MGGQLVLENAQTRRLGAGTHFLEDLGHKSRTIRFTDEEALGGYNTPNEPATQAQSYFAPFGARCSAMGIVILELSGAEHRYKFLLIGQVISQIYYVNSALVAYNI
jgi:hypothetical protein